MIPRTWSLVVVIVAVVILHAGPPVKAQTPAPAKPEAAPSTPQATAKPAVSKPAVVRAKRFASAEEATQSFVTALRADDVKALLGILGGEGRTLVSSGDPVSDRQSRGKFLQEYDAAHRLIPYGTTTVLRVGTDDWPFPIPLVKHGERWSFDARRGREEIIARRIGRNELYTIETCLAYVDAQREYYAEDHNGSGILEYAQKFVSTPGKRDGLYWPTEPGDTPSPLGDLVARARAEGYRGEKSDGPTPYHGYLYRILIAQGPAAPDGQYDYVTRGHMIAGFALVAFPAQYGASGVMTFIVNHDGVVYEKDLGPKTSATARAMQRFNPDGGWAKAEVPELTSTED